MKSLIICLIFALTCSAFSQTNYTIVVADVVSTNERIQLSGILSDFLPNDQRSDSLAGLKQGVPGGQWLTVTNLSGASGKVNNWTQYELTNTKSRVIGTNVVNYGRTITTADVAAVSAISTNIYFSQNTDPTAALAAWGWFHIVTDDLL